MKIHQFVSNFCFADAVSNNVRILRDRFRANGFDSDVFTMYPDSFSENECINFKEYKGNKDNILIMHASTFSEIHDYISKLPNKKALFYHNITPSEFFEGLNNHFVSHLKKGRKQLETLSNIYDIAFSVSEFNLNDLRKFGFKNVYKCPLYIDFSKYKAFGNQVSQKSENSKMTTQIKKILFVGRFAPNKRQDDLIKFLYFYRKFYDENIELVLVGDMKGQENYYSKLVKLIELLDLTPFVKVYSRVSDKELFDFYKNSDLFLSMSEHEGFFVPVIESFYFNLPVIAFDAGAVSETMNGGGLIFKEKNFDEISRIAWKTLNVPKFRENILQKQKSALSDFISSNDDFKLLKILKENFGF